MTNPVPGYSISTPYKKRGPYWSCDEDSYGNGVHTGQDYAAPSGAKCVAARPGTVRHVNHGSAFGNHQIEVECSDGSADFYAHMRSRVAAGTKVDAGDKVGECGAEGNVTGAHLHFERHAPGHSGWSCSIHRDPMPSHNYQASGGAGAGTEDDVLNSDDKDWIKNQIANSQADIIDRMNTLMGDVVSNPTEANEENTVMAKTALGMLLERTD